MPPSDQERLLLLDMLSSVRPVDAAAVAGLSPASQERLARIVRQHRLGPILLDRARAADGAWVLPATIRDTAKQQLMQSLRRAADIRRALGRIATVLGAASIPFVALKGSWLAFHAYREPVLRPMRDVDIWVQRDDARRVWDLLLANGFAPVPGLGYSFERAQAHEKHLPPVQFGDTGLALEIHSRLADELGHDSAASIAADEAAQWGCRLQETLDGSPIGYLDPTDALLHLIVHAAYDHLFNNGPVIVEDIAVLLSRHAVDWPRFWARVDAAGWREGCALTFAMTERQHGAQPVDWCGPAPSPDPAVVRDALLLSLQDATARGTISLIGQIRHAPTVAAKWRIVRKSFAPTDDVLVGSVHGKLALGTAPRWRRYGHWLGNVLHRTITNFSNRETQADSRRVASVRGLVRQSAVNRGRSGAE
jgi:hypothetical protein